jgi:Uma2 family endonuclease
MATTPSVEEQRVTLHNVTWGTYERLLAERGERPAPRFTYDRGTLELMSPLTSNHEEDSRNLEFLVRILAGELGVSMRSFGSMTLKREDVQGGAEPDCCFYLRSEPLIRGKRRLDLGADPPPDLVIEVDVTNPTLDKLPVYARFGVPEVWRRHRGLVTVHTLLGERYAESGESGVLRGVTAADLTRLLGESESLDSAAWERRVRAWARQL